MPPGKFLKLKLALLILILPGIVLAGCGSKKAEETGSASTPAPASPENLPATAELHGEGTCDMCHEAPTLEKMRAGDHKLAFERDPELHKNLCGNCHQVNSFCGKCHPVPEVIKG